MAEKKNIATGYIGNALRSSAADHTTTFTDEVFDTERQKYQSEVNTDIEEKITSEAEARDLAINTEVQARTQNDQLLSQAIVAEQERAETAEQAIIFDVSSNNNGAVFESLSAILSSSDLSTLIPTSVRHGGMTIRFIQGSEQSSNNKYVQYSLTKSTWSTTPSDWEKVSLENELVQLRKEILYGEEIPIQGTLEAGYFGTIGRNTAGYVKKFDVSEYKGFISVNSSTRNEYVVLWALSAVEVSVGDDYSNTLAHSEVTTEVNEDTIDLSLYPTAKYLYVANYASSDTSNAHVMDGGINNINERLESLKDNVQGLENNVQGLKDNVQGLEKSFDLLEQTVNGKESTVETTLQSVSTVTKAMINGSMPRTYLSVVTQTLAVKFYQITPGKHYTISVPKMANEYSYYWGYSNDYPQSGELTSGWDSLDVGSIVDTTKGSSGAKTFEIQSAANFGYISVCYDTTGDEPTVKKIDIVIGNGIKQNVDKLLNDEDSVFVNLPEKIYAVVGDKLQLFYRGIIKAIDPYKYDIVVSCSKGNAFPRYFELTPTINETLNLSIKVKNAKGTVLAEGSTQIICNTASSPSSLKNILCFGDSLTTSGEWVNEANRRLTLGTVEDGIKGSNLNNIAFCGAKTTPNGAGYFGVGGWSWSTYMSQGVTMFRTNVSGVDSCQIGAIYRADGYLYEIMEVNITSGTGTILLSKYSSYSQPSPPASGTLIKASGYGDSEISYSSYTEESYSPLWHNGGADFTNYAAEYANSQVDIVVTLLTWNDGSAGNDFDNFDADLSYMTLWGNTLHTQFPSAKWLLLGIQLPSLNGGVGQNNGANGVTAWGVTKSVFNKNDFYQEFANSDSFKSFTKFINISSQFDSENNMQETDVRVNLRNAKTEERGTNSVHPALTGYMQIADIVYRAIIGEL